MAERRSSALSGGIRRRPAGLSVPARTDPRYGSARWKRTRLRVLQRDGHRCQVVLGCAVLATVADHIVPVTQDMSDAEFYALDNLRASCRRHNLARGHAAALDDGPPAQAPRRYSFGRRAPATPLVARPASGGGSFRYHLHSRPGGVLMTGDMSTTPIWPNDGTCPPECLLP